MVSPTSAGRHAQAGGGVLNDVGQFFRDSVRVPAQRLLVLGEPGAGKTVLAIRLILDQLSHRGELPEAVRAQTPVPLRINAAGWDGTKDFTTWLVDRLHNDYGQRRRVARALVRGAKILPILDGLDEMDGPTAEEPVRARAGLYSLNQAPWKNRPLVVVCRSEVYERLPDATGVPTLHRTTWIVIQPIKAEAISTYLYDSLDAFGMPSDRWEPVTSEIARNPSGILATALSTPLLLTLTTTALYHGGANFADELVACAGPGEIRDLLFATLIPAAIHETPSEGRPQKSSPSQVERWLRTLALHLERQRAPHSDRWPHIRPWQGSDGTDIAVDQLWAIARLVDLT